jgi:serine/threonine-protein kinase RsbW
MNTKSSLRIAAEVKNLSEIRCFVQETASALGLDPATVPKVILAVDEAVSNIIVHGYQRQEGIVEIEVSQERDALVIRIRDEAPPFDPTIVPAPDVTLPLEKRIPGGLGIHLIRKIMDEMAHRVIPQGGNELTLVKRGIREKTMNITTSVDEKGTALVEVEGELDARTAGDLDKALSDLLTQGHSRLALDFTHLSYISSAGLRALLRAQRAARDLGGEVRLFGLNDHVLRVFEMAGFHQMLGIAATYQEAVEGW